MVGEWAVTANLGGTFTSDSMKAGMLEWSSRAIAVRRPMLIFAQEVFPNWIELVEESTDYGVMWAHDTPWRTASAIAYRNDVELSSLTPADVPQLRTTGPTSSLRDGTARLAR